MRVHTYTTHNTKAAKNGAKKPIFMNQSFAQLSLKMDKLEKVIKKQDAKRKKSCRSNSDSDLD
jgi:hypothetical protein